ncbi:hypothetical protein SK128_023400, partial [Halocaridina rubra]
GRHSGLIVITSPYPQRPPRSHHTPLCPNSSINLLCHIPLPHPYLKDSSSAYFSSKSNQGKYKESGAFFPKT